MAKTALNAGFTGDVAEETGAVARTRSAVSRAKDEARMVAAHAADHPAATGSALAVVGMVAFTIGYLLGTSSGRSDSRWSRWH